jgi:hypothetical protein
VISESQLTLARHILEGPMAGRVTSRSGSLREERELEDVGEYEMTD